MARDKFLNPSITIDKITMFHNARVKSSPVTGLDRPRVFQEVKVPTFHDNGTGWW